MLCFKDGVLVAGQGLERFQDLDEGDFSLKRWLAQAGVLASATGARKEESDDEEIDLAPCGVPGCKTMFAHQHVGKGRGTGGVERFDELVDPSKGYGKGLYSESGDMDHREASDDDSY